MWKFDNLKTGITGGRPLYDIVKAYILEKNLNFIIARGNCLNQREKEMNSDELEVLLDEVAACGFFHGGLHRRASLTPFLAADTDEQTKTARVKFLIDLTREARDGKASPFYSKIMGALATQVFMARPELNRLWFPFTLEDTLGRGLGLAHMDGGTAVVRKA